MPPAVQRPPAEILHGDELAELIQSDRDPKPPGWQLSLRAVRRFITGDSATGRPAKLMVPLSLVDRAMVTLASGRGLLLVGEPGTAKSLLSELLAAAISGTSVLTVQGGASTTEDQIKYGWNYALLLNEGPSPRALVPGPILTAMREGRIARFEEITRCPAEVQDSLLSILSERVLMVPELAGDEGVIYANAGFNLIATANTRDRGVNEMSAALKRRFAFETVFPISSLDDELALVTREAQRLLRQSGVSLTPPDDVIEVLVSSFRELRAGLDADGGGMERLSTVLSTAEAVSVAHAVGLRGYYLRGDAGDPGDIVEALLGTAVKDNADDLKKLRRYLEQKVSKRAGTAWRAFYEARHRLPSA
ncbi:ATP-binding protein [Tahibacter amnicola]|uniref:AAA family ATPase n=1 Tax=Tahibacter amnicola TaxID=2976241 RepID=A0ABY6BAC3_9GAMM|nr:AAA family ATPase [Tahibacter amnicola]UXI67013.1 AAA family ATPase [Tahibacter amnicola]